MECAFDKSREKLVTVIKRELQLSPASETILIYPERNVQLVKTARETTQPSHEKITFQKKVQLKINNYPVCIYL